MVTLLHAKLGFQLFFLLLLYISLEGRMALLTILALKETNLLSDWTFSCQFGKLGMVLVSLAANLSKKIIFEC